MIVELANVDSFDFGVCFYDKFKFRICICKKKEVNSLKKEMDLYYQKCCKTLNQQNIDELSKIYFYLLDTLNERWNNEKTYNGI